MGFSFFVDHEAQPDCYGQLKPDRNDGLRKDFEYGSDDHSEYRYYDPEGKENNKHEKKLNAVPDDAAGQP